MKQTAKQRIERAVERVPFGDGHRRIIWEKVCVSLILAERARLKRGVKKLQRLDRVGMLNGATIEIGALDGAYVRVGDILKLLEA